MAWTYKILQLQLVLTNVKVIRASGGPAVAVANHCDALPLHTALVTQQTRQGVAHYTYYSGNRDPNTYLRWQVKIQS